MNTTRSGVARVSAARGGPPPSTPPPPCYATDHTFILLLVKELHLIMYLLLSEIVT